MTRKRKLVALAACGALLVAGTRGAMADTPVIDFTAIGHWIQSEKNFVLSYALQAKQWATENLSWLKQVEQYATQVQQYATEVAQLYGLVHLPIQSAAMQALSMAGLSDSLPVSPYAVQGLVTGLEYRSPGISGIAGLAGNLNGFTSSAFAANHVYTPTDGSWNSQQIIARANGNAGIQGTAQASYDDLRRHQDTLQGLRDKLSVLSTPKDVQDIQAQIAIEQAWIANQQGQLNAAATIAQAQTAAIPQRDNERMAQLLQGFIDRAPTN